ncbi:MULTISPECIES: hypothetical protein [Bradyrhizobium]|uniref:hypothetical protein n=1 Tax=Bradyrhizobium TaxID=374 RepID=UPI001FEFDD79|nr:MULTISPECIES: hypothetical protein [Bradyrhizobium]
MTKTYPPVMRSQLADELNQAFASAEPHQICSAIGQALKDFNVSEIETDSEVFDRLGRADRNRPRAQGCSTRWRRD